MAERPILFSAPMVRAILDGSKTQTRRVVKLRDKSETFSQFGQYGQPDPDGWPWSCDGDGDWYKERSPYGVPGDRVWVRETWQIANWDEDGRPLIRYKADGVVKWCDGDEDTAEKYWAPLSDPVNHAIDNAAADRRWRPSIFMPRWASRIMLEVTDVRVQRLQDISEDDAIAEGVGSWRSAMTEKRLALLFLQGMQARHQCGDNSKVGKRLYSLLWDEINATKAPWSSNPFVWCISFWRVES